jgi:enoyl-CoA hydratase/carnithine racemase
MGAVMAEVVSLRPTEPDGPVVVWRERNILRVTLADPPANALSRDTIGRLCDALDEAVGDPAVRVVVLAARGRTFCAGHDLKELTARRADPDGGRAFFERTMRACADLMLGITRCPKPVIAAVDGLATAAGMQLVASCDLAIASTDATFCAPGVNIGLFCSTPMVALSRNVGPKQAMEMLLTGETIDAATARDWGLVNRVVPREYLAQVVGKYADTIAAKSPLALRTGKAAFYAQAGLPLAEAYDHAVRVMVENMLARDAKEGIGAFLEKRDPNWSGE